MSHQSEYNSLMQKNATVSDKPFSVFGSQRGSISQNSASSHNTEQIHDVPSNKPSVNLGPKIDIAVLPLLSSRKTLVDQLTNLITRERLRYNIPPHLLEIRLHVDAESGQKLIHIKQTVATNAKTAMEYWDKVSVPIDQWISTLPKTQSDIVRNEIFLTIHWNTNVSGQ